MRAAILPLAFCVASRALAEPVFEDASGALPLQHAYVGGWEHFVGGGVAVFDCNGDALPDIYAAGGADPARLFVQEAGERLSFALGEALPALRGVTGAYPLDVDADGHVDLVVLRVGENRLLRGDGACGFTDASAAWGFETDDRWSTAFSATWEAGAGWPTLAIGNYVDRSDPDGPFEACDINQLYRPGADGFAPPVTLSPGFCALSMLFSDWTRSGTAELRISNDRHYYVRGGYEQMWQMTPLRERSAAEGWARVSLWGMGIASADLQGDGYPDVMLTSMGDQVLQMNEAGQMRAAGFATGATAHRPHVGGDGRPSTGWHAEFGDVDNNGLLDLFIAKGNVDQMPGMAMKDPNNLLMQRADGVFEEAAARAGVATMARSRGAALADLDRDGRLDLVVINRRAPMELWLNRTAQTGNWAQVDLRMAGPNRFAIGAWLEIERGAGVEWRERTVGGGHVSGTLLPLHLGLGAAEAVRLRVHWPDGTTGAWQEIAANSRVRLRR
ncbi:MAG: CRTAC1 family protein [Pseudomonadota bacterium]